MLKDGYLPVAVLSCFGKKVPKEADLGRRGPFSLSALVCSVTLYPGFKPPSPRPLPAPVCTLAEVVFLECQGDSRIAPQSLSPGERNPKSLPPGEGGFKIANALAILKTDEGCRAVIFRFRICRRLFPMSKAGYLPVAVLSCFGKKAPLRRGQHSVAVPGISSL